MSGYNRALVEQILPTVWDMDAAYGLKQEGAPDADMPKVKANPKQANTLYAHIADIKQAWKRTPLTVIERQSLVLRYGLDYGYDEIGSLRGVRKSAAQEATERAVGKVTAYLNGNKYIDGYDQLEDEAA
ncbi:DNA binding protein [Streptomyces phage Paedore]|uniref:DNA binding protein n=1 Tax=Streptomyces phage Paedore TaxID=2108134 RepID=A0A2P1JTS3_9CAUD|nr:sigma factor [Streptomyces phage Paedore]AVO22529.1 DNA binding protein [Streptomyces phage Paedore]